MTCSAGEVHGTCERCGKVLFARYDLAAARATLDREAIGRRSATMWRWTELLPVLHAENVVSLGEGSTPLLPASRLGEALGLERVFVKEEGLNPTGSFKARGLAAAVSKAKELGVVEVVLPSAGNAASAAAAYGARAGLKVTVFVPEDTPDTMKREAAVYGADVRLVKGLISDAGRLARAHAAATGAFDLSTLREPYRAEGKKTLGFEIAEHFGWSLPDAIIYPTGGGTGIVGMWKAFSELEELGWIGPGRPKMVSVQAEGCAPIVKAFMAGSDHADPWPDAHTIAPGIRVPSAVADYLILAAVRESGGIALAVSDGEILGAMSEMARLEGLFACPEGAATYAALKKLVGMGFVGADDSVVLFNTGAGIKTPELVARI